LVTAIDAILSQFVLIYCIYIKFSDATFR